MSLFSLEGKVALITGSTKGIGKAIAQRMAEQGATVVISSRNQDACDEVAAEITARGDKAIGVACNINHKDQLQQLVEKTTAALGKIDVLVCNAALNPFFGKSQDIPDEAFDKIMQANIGSVHRLCQLVIPGIAESGGGAVVIISSIGGLKGTDALGAYAISKAADMQIARNLAVEWGPKNVRVNCIAPGLVRTDFAKALWENPDIYAATVKNYPLRRIGEPDEIAGAARALRARLIPIAAPEGTVDCCGTGGDGHHTLNVSTAVSLVVAACGVPVAKHGNRAASSKAGAADTLEALGLDMEAAGRSAEKTLAELGICFLFAKNHHPAMGRIQPIRQKLGVRTIFNLMGPLSNPAGVRRQLIGIARPAYVPIYAAAKAKLGTERTFIASGDEGLDELSLAGGNELADVQGNDFEMRRVVAVEANLPHSPVEAIRGGDPAYNARALEALLGGRPGVYRDAVLFNAAATLIIAGRTDDWTEGAEIAAEALDSGKAKALLENWIAMTA